MRVMVTGASGFIGSFTVPALLAAGHDVVALVRSRERAEGVLGRRCVPEGAVDLRVGDILDRASVSAALDGCQTVIHAAAVVGLDRARAAAVREQNVAGTRNVVGQALAAGCDPVIHLSSVVVFIPPEGEPITAESGLVAQRSEYGRSKLEAEVELRALQAGGAPITILYPGGVVGPDPPSLDNTLAGIALGRRIGWPMARGGVVLLDVRDLAGMLAAAIVPGCGPRRFLAGGHFISWSALADLTDELLGVRVRRLPAPTPVMYGVARLLDAARHVVPIEYPITRDSVEVMVAMVPTDDRPTLEALGVTLRPLRETLTDSLRWLVAAGHLSPRQGPLLAS